MAVGPSLGADGTTPGTAPRQGKTGDAIVSQAHGKYFEATHRGNMYVASNGATGRAPGTALGVTPALMLYNPVGSGKRLAIKKVTAGYISGTLGAGTVFHCGFTFGGKVGAQTNVAPVVGSGASVTPINLDIGSANNAVGVVFALGTLNANPAILYPLATMNAMLATTATNTTQIEEDVDGNIVLEPGSGWCPEAIAAAGSTPLMSFGVVWEEVQIV